MAERDHLIFYDQECGVCRRLLQLIYSRDGKRARRLFPIALQDRAAERELSGMSADERMASWHLKTPAGESISGGAAMAPLAELLELPKPFASVLGDHPDLADRAYALVATNRSTFSRLTRMLPEFERR
jgi:predicted DCC family thiol-disulfide oxidoreductase YuxK